MKSLLLVLTLMIFSFPKLEAASIADASIWIHEKYSGKTCGDISDQDLSHVDRLTNSTRLTCTRSNSISKSAEDINKVAENIFFERMAQKELLEINCQISSIAHFETEDSLIRLRSKQIEDKLPLIKEQTSLAHRAHYNFQQILGRKNSIAAQCRNQQGNSRAQCFEELEKAQGLERAAEAIWQQHQGLVTATMGSLWNGSTEAMGQLINKFLKSDPLPSNDVIFKDLKNQIPQVQAEFEKNKSEFLKQTTGSGINLKFTNLTDETKRRLVETATVDGGILSEAAIRKDDSSIKFLCRLEGRYTKGRDSLHQTVGTATLLVGGAAGLAAKIPIGLRAGQLAGLGAKMRSSPVIIGALATGVDAGIAASAVLSKCFSAAPAYSVKNACPSTASELKESELKKFEQNNCVLEAALSVAPAGILASSKALKTLVSKIGSNKLAPTEIEEVAQVANKVEGAPAKTPQKKSVKNPPHNQYADPVAEEQINVRGPHNSRVQVQVLKYDTEMAKASGLSVQEVVALRKNFSEAIPTTGETGIFRLGDDLILNGKTNLVGAYSAVTQKLKSGAPLTGKDVLEIREKIYEYRSIANGKDIFEIPTKMKGQYSTVIDGEIPPYVQERLKHYQVEFKIEGGKTKITYPDMDKSGFLDQYTAEINRMMDLGYPPEKVAAFAAQDLLILHPFKDGNGRTARVIAQGIYKKMTGKDVVFDEAFKSEMHWDVDDLARTIASDAPHISKISSVEELVRKAYRDNRNILPVMMDKTRVQSAAPRKDVPFPKEFKGRNGETIEYAKLKKHLTSADHTVFYGRGGGETLDSAEKEVEKIFKYGRGSRDPSPHLSLKKHQSSTDPRVHGPSGFFSTSNDFGIAKDFAYMHKEGRYGVVFAIDPKGAEVLNLYKMSGPIDGGEGEVLFGPRLNPARVEVAVIIDSATNQIVKVIRNPGFSPRPPK